MENANEALKMAFAVMVFVMALSITISMFSLARATSDIVLESSDVTQYYEYTEPIQGSENRIVGIDTIISNLYKYNKENNKIAFKTSDGNPLNIYTSNSGTDINYFDLNEEISRSEKWTISNDAITKNLAAFVAGVDNGVGNNAYFAFKLERYRDRQFKEYIQKDTTKATGGNNTTTKMIITYQLI